MERKSRVTPSKELTDGGTLVRVVISKQEERRSPNPNSGRPTPLLSSPLRSWPERPRTLLSPTAVPGAYMGDCALIDVDKLILRGLLFHGFHGVKAEEKKLGQKFLVDVDAWLDLSEAGKTDDISDTISYTDIYRIVKEIVEGPSQNLLESVAHLIANTTLVKFPQISAVRVKVGKPHVAVRGPVDYLGIEIMRFRKTEDKVPEVES